MNMFFYINIKKIFSEAQRLNDRLYNIELYLVGEFEPALGINVKRMAEFTYNTNIIEK